MKNDRLLCWKCRKIVPYSIKSRERIRTIDGKDYKYLERYGKCDICDEEIMVPGLDDENEQILDIIYRSDQDLITVEEIQQIIKKYNIDKRPLSHILGLGEHTISRYLEGALPNKKYSDLLKRLLTYHDLMSEFLEKNKTNITQVAYKKAHQAISEIERMCSHETKIEIVALYIIHRGYEVTSLSLQKLLYYAKAFSWIMLGREMVKDCCEAWAYGPVFPDLYEKYKGHGSSVIADYDQSIEYGDLLSTEELDVLDFVVNSFGIYNGNVLMRLTHKEEPWKQARAGIPEFAPSTNAINNETIYDYFTKMNEKYHLGSAAGVQKYIHVLGVL